MSAPSESAENVDVVAAEGWSRMPYDCFLSERQRIVDARQREQQRFDQLVSGGAAGALVLSITFLDYIAPGEAVVEGRAVLLVSWLFLLLTLGCNFLGHFFSQRAFDEYLESFDRAYVDHVPCIYTSPASTTVRWLVGAAAVSFIIGIVLMAFFSASSLLKGPVA